MKRFLFLDFETTGLDERVCVPIEVAAVVTDEQLNELASYERLIAPNQYSRWEEAAREMHRKTGLTGLAEAGYPLRYVRFSLRSFIFPFFSPTGSLYLAGNSVHFDRRFLTRYFPEVEQLLHHRHLDVSSVRMLAEAAGHPPLAGEKPHRAMAAVRRSLEDARRFLGVLRCP